MERKIKVNTKYKHFKGNLYEVIAIAYDSETAAGEVPRKLVVYKSLYGDGKIWVRDYEMFNSFVDRKKYPSVLQQYRFEEIKED